MQLASTCLLLKLTISIMGWIWLFNSIILLQEPDGSTVQPAGLLCAWSHSSVIKPRGMGHRFYTLTEYDIQQDVDGFHCKPKTDTTQLIRHRATPSSLQCSRLSSLVTLQCDGIAASLGACGQPGDQQGWQQTQYQSSLQYECAHVKYENIIISTIYFHCLILRRLTSC